MVLDRIEQLICTCISKKIGTKIFKNIVFLTFFTVFEHDYVARLDRKTNYYMYLEKIGIKIKKKSFFAVFNPFYRFDMPTTPIVGVGPKMFLNCFFMILHQIPPPPL